MVEWRDLKKYVKKVEGDITEFSVPFTSDKDGFVGRECTKEDCQPKYFKIEPKEKQPEYLYCPYCGKRDFFNIFWTKDQREWVYSMAERDAIRSVTQQLKDIFRPLNRSSPSELFSIRVEMESTPLPSIKKYTEKELKRVVTCDQCDSKYAVYGISSYCPWCGKGNLNMHLDRNIELIKYLLQSKNDIVEKYGEEIGDHIISNCLEDCVSLFEGFLKIIYKNKQNNTMSMEASQRKVEEIRNSFQNINKTKLIFENELGIKIYDLMDEEEIEFLDIQFNKRHVITHNLGLVDEKYRNRVAEWQKMGENVLLNEKDIFRTLETIKKIIINVL